MNSNIDPIEQLKATIKQAFPGDKILGDNDNIDRVMDLIKTKNIAWNGNARSRQLSYDFLNEAERDIKSYKVLYSKKIYPHAVYHFQQAVEKSMKGYCLALGMLSIEEIKSHDTPYVLLKGVLEKTGLKDMLQSLSAESKILLDKAWEAQDDLEKRLKIAGMPFEQIINELNSIDNDREKTKQIRDALLPMLLALRIGSQALPLEITTLPVLASLYRLGAVSFPHEAFTRYPDDEKMTPTEYVSELGIVKAIPKMTKYLVTALKELRLELAQVQ